MIAESGFGAAVDDASRKCIECADYVVPVSYTHLICNYAFAVTRAVLCNMVYSVIETVHNLNGKNIGRSYAKSNISLASSYLRLIL